MLNYNNVCLSAFDKKKITAIVDAVCEYFDITEKALLQGCGGDILTLRHYCYFLMKINTNVNRKHLSSLFGKSETSVRYGIDKISSQSAIYSDVIANLKNISSIVNKHEGIEIKCKI